LHGENSFELLVLDALIGIAVLAAMMFLAKKCEEGDFETWQRVGIIVLPVILGLLGALAIRSVI
jgi:hypothetical protein